MQLALGASHCNHWCSLLCFTRQHVEGTARHRTQSRRDCRCRSEQYMAVRRACSLHNQNTHANRLAHRQDGCKHNTKDNMAAFSSRGKAQLIYMHAAGCTLSRHVIVFATGYDMCWPEGVLPYMQHNLLDMSVPWPAFSSMYHHLACQVSAPGFPSCWILTWMQVQHNQHYIRVIAFILRAAGSDLKS